MAQKFILLSVLWLVVAIFATSAEVTAEGELIAATTDDAATTPTGDATTAATGDATTTPTGDATTAATGDATTAATGDVTTGESTTAIPTTSSKDPCNPNPCGTGSTCEARFEDAHVCLCLPGDFYSTDSNSCERSKVFPGKLKLKITFDEKMTNRKSKEFNETADKVISKLKIAYEGDSTYSGSVVLELLPSTTSKSTKEVTVDSVVQIIFKASSEITTKEVTDKLDNCAVCEDVWTAFETMDLCANDPCDKKTANCTSGDGTYECICKDGYVQTNYSTRMCIAACSFGEKLKDNKCVKCSFGYSGINCSENWQLILVIVGSVLGGLLLIAIILLPVVATQKSNKSFKKHKSAENEKQPMADNKFGHSQGVSFNGSANGHSGFQNGAVPMFPRAANPTNSMDNRSNLEMKPSNGRQNFGHMNSGSRIYDEPEDIRPYAQTRPQSNPYAQNQPRMNPYAQNQGHSNPHYAHDDGRRYY